MQLLPPLNRDRARAATQEVLAGHHLPYARHIDDHTIETRDGMLLQTIRLRGLLFETADTDELNYRKVLRAAMLQSLGSSRFAFYHHVVRRRIDPIEFDASFPDPFSQRLSQSWQDRLKSRQLFVNDLFLTIVRRPIGRPSDALAWMKGFFGKSAPERPVLLRHELRELHAAREATMAQLDIYQPHLLSVYDTTAGACSEPMEFLSALYNAEIRPVLLPRQDLGAYLPYRRVSFGEQTAELGPAAHLPRSFTALVSIKDYAGHTAPGMFDQLLRLPFHLAVSQSFAFVDRPAALSRMNLALRRMKSAEDEALSLRAELDIAKDEVAAGRSAYGEHHMTVAIHGESVAEVDAGVAEVQASLADLGINAVREDIGLEPAFWAQFPGNFKYATRRGLISTTNFAGLASSHNFGLGNQKGNHWGDAIALLETTAAGPYYFNFHHGDLGNFTVIGPSGSGKTVVLNFLLAQARKLSPRIIFFDKDRGAEIFIRAIGGVYDILRPGEASGLNPLQLPDSPANRQFLIDWIACLAGGIDVEEQAHVKKAVDINFDQPLPFRRLFHLVELFRGGHRPHPADLWSRLRPWWGEGEHSWLFDNLEDRTDLSALTVGFDMTQILDDPTLRTPAMMYLFHRVEERLDGSPAIIVVDEGWKALDDEVFVQKIRDWEKTIRKRNGIVGFATQSAQDALESRIATAIIEQAATQIFMANPKARASDYVDGFGLTEHEYDLIRTLPDNAHCFLVKHGHDSVVVRLDLTGEREMLAVLSGRERTVRLLDEIREGSGDDPEVWLPRLLEQI
ncbi:MAG TPA: VirB4 family type IV secretion/conjugal transfer ATPase [Sphingobium sp.]